MNIDLRLHGTPVKSVFSLVGFDENSITYSLGWSLSRSAQLRSALLTRLFGRRFSTEVIQSVELQSSLMRGFDAYGLIWSMGCSCIFIFHHPLQFFFTKESQSKLAAVHAGITSRPDAREEPGKYPSLTRPSRPTLTRPILTRTLRHSPAQSQHGASERLRGIAPHRRLLDATWARTCGRVANVKRVRDPNHPCIGSSRRSFQRADEPRSIGCLGLPHHRKRC